MDFDLFEKLSDLETRIYVLEKELEEKDALIQELTLRNSQLEQQLQSQKQHPVNAAVDLENRCDLATIESGKSIAEVLRETSESVVRHTGYAFDERTGLYFDHVSGYYYDPEHQLFFEPKTGTYYSYNSETGEYAYRSSVDSHRLARLRELFCRPSEISKQPQPTMGSGKLVDVAMDTESSPKQNRNPVSRRHSRRHRHRSRKRSRTPSRRSRNVSGQRYSPARSPHRCQNVRRHSGDSDTSFNGDSLTISTRGENRTKCRRINTCSSKELISKHDKENIRDGPNPSTPPPEQQVTSFVAKPMVYPPGMRLTVLASEYTSVGSVFILTSEESSRGWGCIGRNPTFCPSVNFPDDPDVGTIHCEVIYNQTEEYYSLLDRESSSGTFINGQLLPKTEPVRLSHGDIVRIGATRLLVHIHRGSEICDQCDPSTLRLALEEATDGPPSSPDTAISEEVNGLSAADRRDIHRRVNIDLLKEKYGIRHLNSINSNENPKGYIDRASQRRFVESTLKAAGVLDRLQPSDSDDLKQADSTTSQHTPSLSTPIGAENRGAQLLAKMGWKDGEGLGKNRSGIVEPVPVAIRLNARAGFGSEEQQRRSGALLPVDATPRERQKAHIRVITRDRFDKIQ